MRRHRIGCIGDRALSPRVVFREAENGASGHVFLRAGSDRPGRERCDDRKMTGRSPDAWYRKRLDVTLSPAMVIMVRALSAGSGSPDDAIHHCQAMAMRGGAYRDGRAKPRGRRDGGKAQVDSGGLSQSAALGHSVTVTASACDGNTSSSGTAARTPWRAASRGTWWPRPRHLLVRPVTSSPRQCTVSPCETVHTEIPEGRPVDWAGWGHYDINIYTFQ